MINFDALILKLFYEENSEFLIGAKIQKIQQPNRSELVLIIRNFSETRKFYINFNPQFYHLCFMSKDNELRRNITIPQTAPMFCMLLRKYIQNAKIIKVDVPKYERIFEIYFEYYDELNEKSQLCLAIELMGKYSNVILYNYDTNVIIGCAHNVSAEKSRERELYGMLPYIYPLKQKKNNLTKVTFESFKSSIDIENIAQSIASKYHYLTISFVQDVIDSINPFSLEMLYERLKSFLNQKKYRYFITQDHSKYFLEKVKNGTEYNCVNDMIDEYFSYHQNKVIILNLKTKIFRFINTQLKKLYALKTKQEVLIKKIDKANSYKIKADIIMANLYSLEKGIRKTSLYDFEGNIQEIELDENLSPVDNANRYYNLYKKAKNTYEHAVIMINETNSQILYFEEISYFVQSTSDINELNDIYDELIEEKESNVESIQKIDFIEFQGTKIYIGKNKKQNDYILSKLSSAEDLWFHPLNAPGAHVLVKSNNKKEIILDEILLKAAQLTKEFSSQKNNSKTSIIYTKRKYVKKANNKQAFVTYKNETEIIV